MTLRLILFSGLREATEGMIKKKQIKALTPWEEYLQKKKEKKERKREERKEKHESREKQLEVSADMYWVTSRENLLFMPYVNNKGVDQTWHLCSLISAFVNHCQDSTI